MKKTILNSLGINASKDIPIEDLFSKDEQTLNGYGITTDDVKKLKLLKNFCNAYNKEIPVRTNRQILRANDAVKEMYNILRDLDHEEVWVMFMNRANQIQGREMFYVGGLDQCTLDCHYIAKRALEMNSKALILFHNHPSGIAFPSEADIKQTEILSNMLKAIDMSLTDHIIISNTQYYSFAEQESFPIKNIKS